MFAPLSIATTTAFPEERGLDAIDSAAYSLLQVFSSHLTPDMLNRLPQDYATLLDAVAPWIKLHKKNH